MEPTAKFIGHDYHVFRERNVNGGAELIVPMTRYTPQHCMVKLAPAQINCNFLLFYCVERFLQTFPNTFQALRSVELKCLLKAWSSNSCVICGRMKIPSFSLNSLILEEFCLKKANPSLYLSTALTDNFIKPSLICNGGKQIFYLRTTAGCATFLWPGTVSEQSGHFFIL